MGRNGNGLPDERAAERIPDARELAFDAQAETREIERVVGPPGFSGTVRAVIERWTR